MLAQMNAKHAEEHAGYQSRDDRAPQEGAAAAAVVRDLSDEPVAKSGTAFTGRLPMTTEQIVVSGLINHIDEHFGSIRKTIGG